MGNLKQVPELLVRPSSNHGLYPVMKRGSPEPCPPGAVLDWIRRRLLLKPLNQIQA